MSLEKNINLSKADSEYQYNRYLNIIQKILGKSSTTDVELTKTGHLLFGRKYIGTYPSDKIPKMDPGEYAILNLDNSKESGSHWIAVVKEEKKIIIYDSFGRKTYSILPQLYNSGNGVIKETENDAEQTKLESNCGQRCLAALSVYNKFGEKSLLHI